VTPIAASNKAPLESAMREDLENLVSAVSSPSADVVIVMSPGNLAFASSVLPPTFAYTLMASSAVATDQVVAVDAGGVAAAISAEPQIAVSEVAAVHEEDSAPLPLSATGSPNTVAAPMRSSFQTDFAVLRVIAHCAWAARPGSVAAITTVSW
jgi:hypothetical protein